MAEAARHGTVEVGAILADTYEITRLLGRGGMGAVWEARHLRLEGKKVAVKVLHPDVASDADAVARFRREAQIASRLGHPNIVQVHDFNTLPDGAAYLVLEYLEGESLADRVRRGPLPLDQVAAITRQIGSALHAAHRENIVHRDLKPHNVFLSPTEAGGYVIEQVKVLDFGISKVRGSKTVETQTTAILGTPQYMAPEQAMGHHDAVDARTDVFALGAMIYEMLAGQAPFEGHTIPEVMFKVVYGEPTPLAERVPSLPPHVVTAVERALAKKQEDRFPDVSSFVEALTGNPLSTLRGGAGAPGPVSALGGASAPAAASQARARSEEAYAATVAPGTAAGLVSTQAGLAGTQAGPGDALAATMAPGAQATSGDALAATMAPGAQATSGDALAATVAPGAQATSGDALAATVAPGVHPAAPVTLAAPAHAGQQTGSAATGAGPLATPAATAVSTGAAVPGTPMSAGNQGQGVQRRALLPYALGLGALLVAVAALVVVLDKRGGVPTDAHQPAAVAHGGQEGNQADTSARGPGEPGPGMEAARAGEPPRHRSEPPPPRGDTAPDSAAHASDDQHARRRPPPSPEPKHERGRRPPPPRGHEPPPPPPENELPASVQQELDEATDLLEQGKADAAIRLARRTLGTKRTPVAYALLTRAFCVKRDLGNARANFRHVRGRLRARLLRFCDRYEIDLR